MTKDPSDLRPDFWEAYQNLLSICRSAGHNFTIFYTLRTPHEQAKLWRQSRSTHQINAKISELRRTGAPFLASCIADVGPQDGRPVTNALPGLSWHNWGEAADAFLVDNVGKANWNAQAEGYRYYADQAKKLGLTPGYYFTAVDAVHVQMRPGSSPLNYYSVAEIDKIMKDKFGS